MSELLQYIQFIMSKPLLTVISQEWPKFDHFLPRHVKFIVYVCVSLQMTDVEKGGSTVFLDAESLNHKRYSYQHVVKIGDRIKQVMRLILHSKRKMGERGK